MTAHKSNNQPTRSPPSPHVVEPGSFAGTLIHTYIHTYYYGGVEIEKRTFRRRLLYPHDRSAHAINICADEDLPPIPLPLTPHARIPPALHRRSRPVSIDVAHLADRRLSTQMPKPTQKRPIKSLLLLLASSTLLPITTTAAGQVAESRLPGRSALDVTLEEHGGGFRLERRSLGGGGGRGEERTHCLRAVRSRYCNQDPSPTTDSKERRKITKEKNMSIVDDSHIRLRARLRRALARPVIADAPAIFPIPGIHHPTVLPRCTSAWFSSHAATAYEHGPGIRTN